MYMKKILPIVVIGIVFSIANAFVSMYLGMKTGFADGIAVLLMFAAFIIFTAIGVKSRLKSLVCVSAIIMGSTGISIAYTDGLGAILLSGTPFEVPDYAMMAILVLSGITGILMSSYFSDYFIKSPFPWPSSRMMASLITMLAAEKDKASQKVSVIRMGGAAFLSGGIASLQSFNFLPGIFGSVNLGLSASPMMAGIGMLIGWRSCLQMAGGAIVSLLVFVLLESPGTDYSTHMRGPWIFSTSIAMMVTTAIITMYFVLKPAILSFTKRQRADNVIAADGGARKPIFTSASLHHFLLIAVIASAALMLAIFPGVPVWIFLPAVLIAILFMVVETRGRAEMGMGVGMSSFVILLIVGLAFDNIVPLLVLEGFVVAMIITFSLMFQVFKQWEFCGVDTKGITTMAMIGVVTGAIICVPFMKFFNALYGIGSASLPAPYSVMWLEMANSAVAKVMSPSINLYLILAGVVVALILYRFKLSAVTVAIGLMLPVSTSAMILVGGGIAWVIEKKGYLKNDNGITASGLMAGDIIVSIIASLRYL
jgi:uncharacterized oligopeptide transporter (OPT) family protein